MLPIYKAIAFDQIIDKGGRTRPWSVLVDTPDGIRPYVVKMFTNQLVTDRDSVTNEVLGNVLAPEFDLPVPKAAFIEMDEDFRRSIQDEDALVAFDMADDRIKFGTELIDGNVLFNSRFTRAQASKMIELDTLFAFDCLIRNRDRNAAKPNLLVKSQSAYLIDHELGFEIGPDLITQFRRGEWEDRFYMHHICWNYLRRARRPGKLGYFNTFEEYLRMLNVKALGAYFQQLRGAGYSVDRHGLILKWLVEAKQNSGNFVTLLKGFIS